jgi:hypothetical protein
MGLPDNTESTSIMVMARRIDGGMDVVTKFGCIDCGTVALQLKHEELLNVSVNSTSEKHPVMTG